MTVVLISGVILIAAGCFTAGAVLGPRLRDRAREFLHPAHVRSATAPSQALPGGALPPSQAASVLLANQNAEALGFPMRIGLTPAEHADAMHELARPYLPPSPAGEHPYPPYVPAWRAIEPVRTGEHPPWTGSQIALDEAAEAEMDRVRYVRAQLAECGDRPTADDLRRVLDSLRRPVYGEAPQLEVREAGRLAGVMLP